jgi:uncharacterized protein (TIGR02996 family)
MNISPWDFLEAILESPDDDLPRLVYADWLDEHDESNRASFIRTQIERSRLPFDDPRQSELHQREKALLDAHAAAWREPFGENHRCTFVRGFVESISVELDELLEHGTKYFRSAPLRGLYLTSSFGEGELAAAIHRLGRYTFLSRVEVLSLYDSPIGEEAAAILFGSGLLSRLRRLYLGEDDATPAMVDVLATAALPALEELYLWDFHQGELGDEGLARLAAAEAFARLTTLDLLHTGAGPAGAEAIATSGHLRRLRNLSFGQMACGYSNNRIGAAGARALASSANLATVESLGLALNRIGDAGLAALAESPCLTRLRILCAEANEISDAGLRSLAKSVRLAGLQTLDLSHNAISDEGTIALANAEQAAGLRTLWLMHNQVGPRGVRALAESPLLTGLRRLSLSRNSIGDDGVQALLRSPLVEQLHELHLQWTPLSEEQKEQLRHHYGERVRL